MNNDLSNRLIIEEYKGMKYIYVDQTNLLPWDMVKLSKMHQELALKTSLPFVTNFEGTFVTPLFMQQADDFFKATKHLIRQGSVIGLNQNKKVLLRAVNNKHSQNIKSHNAKEEALEFIFNNEPIKE